MKLTRQALYEALWKSPRKELAEDWSLNATTITAACKFFKIPLPPPGYWTRVKMGKQDQWPTLQGPTDDLIELVDPPAAKPKINKSPLPPKTTQQKAKTATACKTTQKVSDSDVLNFRLCPSIAETLPAIRKAYQSYSSSKAAKDFRYKHVLPASDSIIRMTVMPELVERALLVLDALLRRFKANKWNVQIPATTDRSKNSVEVDGVTILFSIVEQRRQEKIKSESTWTEWEYVYHSTGILRFQYSTSPSIWAEIKDLKRTRLEYRIDEIIQTIKNEVTRLKQAEHARKERARLSQLGDELSGLVKLALEHNRACSQRLDCYLEQFEKAERIRRFAEAFRGKLTTKNCTPEHEQWLEWANSKANELDPISNPNTFNFTVPMDITSRVNAMIDEAPERYGVLRELDLDASVESTLRLIANYPRKRY